MCECCAHFLTEAKAVAAAIEALQSKGKHRQSQRVHIIITFIFDTVRGH